jgi:hypothetical protein
MIGRSDEDQISRRTCSTLFAGDQVMFSESEYDLQTATPQLQIRMNSHNLEISTKKTDVLAF